MKRLTVSGVLQLAPRCMLNYKPASQDVAFKMSK